MSIFRREVVPPPAKPAAPPRPAAKPNVARPPSHGHDATHIANGTKVVGEISGQAQLVVDGVVDGSIHLQSEVVIGGQGRVEGTVHAESIQVGGKVHGNIRGVKKVEVLTAGSLEGDVTSPRVVIADGAFFKGKVEMTEAGPVPSRTPGDGKKRPGQPAHVSAEKGAPAQTSPSATPATRSVQADKTGPDHKPMTDNSKGGSNMQSRKNRGGR